MIKTGIAQLNTLLASLNNRIGLEQMTFREKVVLGVGVLFVAVVVVYQIMISPYLDARARLLNSIERKGTELREVIQLKQQYAEIRVEEGGIKANLAQRDSDFTLFAFLDRQAEKADVKPQIKYMKPSVITGVGEALDESVVELKMEGVTLERLVDFLRLTESDENVVYVRRLSIQTSARTDGYLDVILQIVTLVEAG